MAAIVRPKPIAPPYVGATTCDLVPDWRDTDPDLLGLLRTAHVSDPDDLAQLLIAADRLAEMGDPREGRVRIACDLWAACRTLAPAGEPWDYERAKAALGPACESAAGWHLAGLWGCLVAWHAPAGDGSGPSGRTWADERVRVVNRCLWWWWLGFLKTGPADHTADVAASLADAVRRQAYADRSQTYAAESQVWQFARLAWSLCESRAAEWAACR